MLGAMLYVLRTGVQWNALPREIGASTTVYDRFRAWEREGVFARLWAAGLGEFDELVGIEWEWLALDGVMTKAPFGRAATAEAEGIGHNPTDRGKQGTKRSTLSDGHGLPLTIVVAGANVHDLKLAGPTLDAIIVGRPAPTAEQPQHLCLDAGYDYDLPRFAAEQRGYRAAWLYRPHPAPRGGPCPRRLARPGQATAPLGGRAAAQLAQSLAAAAGALGEAGAHVRSVPAFGLCAPLLPAG
jgi:putative transposase